MTNSNRLFYFGCSFTSYETKEVSNKRFLSLIRDAKQIDTKDFSKSGKSNSHIIDDVYKASKSIDLNYNNIFIIQTTFLNRLGIYSDLDNQFISLTKMNDNQSDNFKDTIYIHFYNQYLKYFYNSINSLYEFEKQINFISSYLRYKNIQFIFIGIDEHLDLINDTNFFIKNNFLLFEDTYSFYGYAIKNKLRISDDLKNKDHHFNQSGHNILSEKILEKLESQLLK